jgi:hypothetical protein
VSESNSRSWKGPFLEALLETDKAKITKLAYASEGAMFLRLQELAGSSDHHEERSEMQVACAALLSIRVHKLGWPCTLPSQPGWPLSPPRQVSSAARRRMVEPSKFTENPANT